MRSVAQPFAAIVLVAALSACASTAHQASAIVPTPVVAAARLVYENRPTAERTIAGRVIDDVTGLPLKVPGTVRFDDRTDAVPTDNVGHVDVDGVEPGVHTIVTMAPGFASRTDTVLVRDAGGVAIEMRLMRVPVEAGMLVRPAAVTAYVVPSSINARRSVGTELASAP